ncbi:MAG: hypothetical protein LBM94_00885 [Propionibacteriaceae bacterium]|jgi:serine O-acetyltransferase|nr:hypothetical protein [Propionibacteriaceae bacterium]
MSKQSSTQLEGLVGSLAASYTRHPALIKIDERNYVNSAEVVRLAELLRQVLFPGFFAGKPLHADSLTYYVGDLLEQIRHGLSRQISRAIIHVREDDDASAQPLAGVTEDDAPRVADELTHRFLTKLSSVRDILATDLEATYDGDPSAFNHDEIVLSYPGFLAIVFHRLAHELYLLDVPLIPRMINEYAHSVTGIDIHPGATIGHHFFIDHGTGIVIGQTSIIGDYVKIYQGVTVGALSTRGGQMLHYQKRHPTVEDNVTIYAGASILGAATVIGAGVVVGSNAFITRSVPEKTQVSVKDPELLYRESTGNRTEAFPQDEDWIYSI